MRPTVGPVHSGQCCACRVALFRVVGRMSLAAAGEVCRMRVVLSAEQRVPVCRGAAGRLARATEPPAPGPAPGGPLRVAFTLFEPSSFINVWRVLGPGVWSVCADLCGPLCAQLATRLSVAADLASSHFGTSTWESGLRCVSLRRGAWAALRAEFTYLLIYGHPGPAARTCM